MCSKHFRQIVCAAVLPLHHTTGCGIMGQQHGRVATQHRKRKKLRVRNRCIYTHIPTYKTSKEERDIVNLIQSLILWKVYFVFLYFISCNSYGIGAVSFALSISLPHTSPAPYPSSPARCQRHCFSTEGSPRSDNKSENRERANKRRETQKTGSSRTESEQGTE